MNLMLRRIVKSFPGFDEIVAAVDGVDGVDGVDAFDRLNCDCNYLHRDCCNY